MKKSIYERSLNFHEFYKGKIELKSKVKIDSYDDLSLAYSPGVAQPCIEIHSKKDEIYKYTSKGNLVAVVTDGTSILGLGNIGADAGMPVMEGKAILFKKFAGIDAFPICLDTTDSEEIIKTVKNISPSFGGINLEDISAPRCFEIETRLKKILDIPVFHDDQHGTAVVVLAGLMNSLKVVKKTLNNIKVVIAGAGAAGTSIAKILLSQGVNDVLICDSKGIISIDRAELNPYKKELALITNKNNIKGSLSDALKGADVFIGLAVKGLVSSEMVSKMADNSIVFPLSNPEPEIMPDEAFKGGAKIVGTGRSDYPNQINNALAFPGILRGALCVRAKDINEEMKLAAAFAIASLVEPTEHSVIPSIFDERVAPSVASAVAKAAISSGVARVEVSPDKVAKYTRELVLKKRD